MSDVERQRKQAVYIALLVGMLLIVVACVLLFRYEWLGLLEYIFLMTAGVGLAGSAVTTLVERRRAGGSG